MTLVSPSSNSTSPVTSSSMTLVSPASSSTPPVTTASSSMTLDSPASSSTSQVTTASAPVISFLLPLTPCALPSLLLPFLLSHITYSHPFFSFLLVLFSNVFLSPVLLYPPFTLLLPPPYCCLSSYPLLTPVLFLLSHFPLASKLFLSPVSLFHVFLTPLLLLLLSIFPLFCSCPPLSLHLHLQSKNPMQETASPVGELLSSCRPP